MGYILMIIISEILMIVYVVSNAMILSFFSRLCLQFCAFRFQFQYIIDKLHRNCSEMAGKISNYDMIQIKKHFCQAIELHIHYKRFEYIFIIQIYHINYKMVPYIICRIFEYVEILYSGVLFIESVFVTIYIGISVLQLDLVCTLFMFFFFNFRMFRSF